MRVPDQVFARAGVARQHDAPVPRFEAIAEGLFERIVGDVERGHRDPVDVQRRAFGQFADPDVRHSPGHLSNPHPQFEVRAQQVQQLADHRPGAFGPVDMPGPVVAHHPAGGDEMAQVDEVVRMEMGDEQVIDLVRHQAQLDHPVDDAGAAVDDEVARAGPHRVARPAPLRVGERQSGAQQAHLHLRLHRGRTGRGATESPAAWRRAARRPAAWDSRQGASAGPISPPYARAARARPAISGRCRAA